MNRKAFRRLVEEALDELPPLFSQKLENVEIVVEDWPTAEQLRNQGLDPEQDTLYGLYEGTPLPERAHDHGMALPDRITIFYGPLVQDFRTRKQIREQVRLTVIHEIAHFFGLDDDEIEDLGY
jgi:predicted Zn-dependent protease with MMP-like domain